MAPRRFLMSASAAVLGFIGLICVFAPEITLSQMGASSPGSTLLVVQVTGALYMGFAALNWMSRGNAIGGIYGRPITIGNLMHFMVAGLAMIKVIWRTPELSILFLLAVVYAIFAVSFALVAFKSPTRASGDNGVSQ